jgi:carboxymethylenebutenolidase
MALNIAQAETDLRGAVAALRARPGVTSVGVVGFCMGGQLALLAATTSEDVDACVDFYGIHPKIKPDFRKLSCPVLGLFGEKDESVSPAVVGELVAAVRAAGKDIEHHIYPGVGHAFFNDGRPEVYDRVAADDAWKRALGFFDAHLS